MIRMSSVYAKDTKLVRLENTLDGRDVIELQWRFLLNGYQSRSHVELKILRWDNHEDG